ncbi:MAG: inositol monophosphatase family protein [Planctomycetota bacterium]|jgi:fructose-1,6-bisphosphatase/inositol monophosphatase family enzyme
MPDNPADSSSELEAMERIAAEHLRLVARKIVRPSFGGPRSEHTWLSHTQVHTVDDERAGAYLAELFARSFPGHGLVVEDRETIPGDGVYEWFIDPIDGSANHMRGIPYVSITAGLMRDGEPVVGAVHDLMRDVTLSASRGNGARLLNEDDEVEPVHVSDTSNLQDAMLIAHLSRRGPLVCIPDVLQHVLFNIRKIRCMGSIALDLALLAGGEADLLVVGRGSPQRMLDIVGGLVVVEEAGGAVMTAEGHPVSEKTRTLVAGPPELCRAFVALMERYDLEGWRHEDARPPN